MKYRVLSRAILLLSIWSFMACASARETNRSLNENFNAAQTNAVNQSNEKTSAAPVSEPTNAPKKDYAVKPSDIIESLHKKRNANPKISARELADYGNGIIKTKGYDYTFDWQPKGEKNEKTLAKSDFRTLSAYDFDFTAANGEKAAFKLYNIGFEHPCFSVIDLPLTKIGLETMTMTTDQGEIEVKIPKEFELEEMALVDDAKKPLKKWKVPIDALPVGISEDGKKIYIDSWEFTQDAANGYKESPLKLALEIGENGALRLLDAAEIKSGEGADAGYDKEYTEIQYKKYKVGGKEYTLKYSAPCT